MSGPGSSGGEGRFKPHDPERMQVSFIELGKRLVRSHQAAIRSPLMNIRPLAKATELESVRDLREDNHGVAFHEHPALRLPIEPYPHDRAIRSQVIGLVPRLPLPAPVAG